MRLPPGVSGKDFADALRQFQEAVGKEWVFSSDEDTDLYRDAYSPFWHEAEEPIPSAAVAPDGVEQIQQILKVANDYKIPLWTISTGKNLAYGGAAPLLSGSVVLDLKRMNRILEVNEENAYALVEPGVSYFDLYRYIQDRGLKLWIDPPDPGWGSPIGNWLRARRRPHPDARSLGRALRHGSGAGKRRCGADGHGSAARFQNVATVSVRIRALRRWHVFAVELRRRDEDGVLAAA